MLLWLANLDFAGGGVISRYTGPRPSDIARLKRKRQMLLNLEARRLELAKEEEEKKRLAELEIAKRKAEAKQASDHKRKMQLQADIASLSATISALEGDIERLKDRAEIDALKAKRTMQEIRTYRDNEAIVALISAGAI